MGRARLQLLKIEDAQARHATLTKRTHGLCKKAQELSILCDAEVGLMIFPGTGKMSEAAHPRCMEAIIDRYHNCTKDKQPDNQDGEHNDGIQNIEYLKKEVDRLELTCRHMIGERLSTLGLKELFELERKLEESKSRVRTQKDVVGSKRTQERRLKDQEMHKDFKRMEQKVAVLQEMLDATQAKDAQASTSQAVVPFLFPPSQPIMQGSDNGSAINLQLFLSPPSNSQSNGRWPSESSHVNDHVNRQVPEIIPTGARYWDDATRGGRR